jgi:hypothetical protein
MTIYFLILERIDEVASTSKDHPAAGVSGGAQ